ncbi:peptide ABC transporter permease [Subtercola boreus]|uniref:Peptide ABC transporter permease n=1 Tax=Subtercola boreus TaxID=120213 RepID=A0A3E0VMT7_9MICO|nr:peptide ABC transporter permease [Subtercola boreus]
MPPTPTPTPTAAGSPVRDGGRGSAALAALGALRHLHAAEIAAALVLLFLLVAAIAPQLLTASDPLGIAPADAFTPPSPGHWFGTDESGRDIFTRVVYGARSSLVIGVAATAIGLVLAVVLGSLAGLGPRPVDFGVNRLLEVLFAFPGLLLALLFITIFGPGVATSTVAVGLATAPGYARIIRSEIRSIRGSGYIESATVLGRSPAQIFRRHILPNVAAGLFALATLGVGQAIVWAAALSFLGLGAVPPAAEWGAMLSAGRTYISVAWWLTFFPGAFVVLAAASATLLGRGLQRRNRER